MDVPSGPGGVDDLLVGLAIFIGLVLLLVLVPVVLVLAVAVAELLVLLLLLPLFVVLRAGRVARWPIEAWRGDGLVIAEAVRGWASSRSRMQEIADDIRLGRLRPASLPEADRDDVRLSNMRSNQVAAR
ncbi:hypothetical protein [Aeromicrobium sp. UC242_57]|uniref:hypothetical protein n=1 Tax=Aeromicrobium sp. UC242_57 TaxID=3374624 RepID=UPI0037BEC986